jgi:hypothetical protein
VTGGSLSLRGDDVAACNGVVQGWSIDSNCMCVNATLWCMCARLIPSCLARLRPQHPVLRTPQLCTRTTDGIITPHNSSYKIVGCIHRSLAFTAAGGNRHVICTLTHWKVNTGDKQSFTSTRASISPLSTANWHSVPGVWYTQYTHQPQCSIDTHTVTVHQSLTNHPIALLALLSEAWCTFSWTNS